ncbi:Ribonuclease III [Neofusicoccum parvum]|nr:Ribonuclease III [Neofusicoccum parvum]
MVLRAITASSTNEQDYQRLEFLGDTILKYSTAVQLMAEHLQWPESYLTERKDRIVSNGSLAKASRRVGLDKFIFTKSFTGAKWRPRYVHDVLTRAAVENPEKRPISTKILADVVESLIGTAYIEGGMLKAHRCISTFLTSVPWRPLHECRNILSIQAASEHASAPPLHLECVEELIGYTFHNKYLLLEALTHPSFTSYREAATSSYQRLEFLGDAVLDYLVSRRLYAHRNPAPPNAAYAPPPRGHAASELPHGTLHSIRSALVNASFLAFLCMEATLLEPRAAVAFTPQPHSTAAFGTATPVPAPPSARALHHFMRHSAPTLQAASAAATARHAARRAAVWAALRGAARYPWPALAAVGAEKFFSDVVEAVLGAVFVDSEGTEGEGGGMEACEAFLVRLGLVGVLERVLRDGVDTLHPRLELGRLAGSEKVVWGWGEGEGEGVEEDENEIQGGENGDEGQGGGKAGGVVRCRVGIGERWVGGWVEGPSRLAAQTEAADRAVLILRAEKAARKVGVMQDDEEEGLEGESVDDGKSESEVDQAMSGVETEVGQDVIMGET